METKQQTVWKIGDYVTSVYCNNLCLDLVNQNFACFQVVYCARKINIDNVIMFTCQFCLS